jgi:hypothetical protein
MPSTLNAVNDHEYRRVPITALAESASNPRKRFDERSLRRICGLCAWSQKPHFVSFVILWQRTHGSAWEWRFAFPNGT